MKKKLMRVLTIFIYGLIALYALLTALAALIDISAKGFHGWHILYFMAAILLILSLTPKMPTYLLYFSFIFMIAVAIFNGFITKELYPSHILVRAILSVILSLGWYCIRKSQA